MDDRIFDEQTARNWIRTIESGSSMREQDVYPLLRAWIEAASPSRILEIGCGQGDCSARINLARRSYVGIDPSPFLIKRARELYESEERRFQLGNAYALPFADPQFQAVFSVMVWHLLGDIQQASREMSRVLRPGGHFLIVTANPKACSEWAQLYRNTRIEGRRLEGDLQVDGKILNHDILYFHSREEIVDSLRLAKCEVRTIEPFRKSGPGQGREYLISVQGTLLP